jgi:lipopolysaccharide/colanic/teichoic acid biosynthesis glycosyltransferase
MAYETRVLRRDIAAMSKDTAALDNYTNAEQFRTADLATKTGQASFRRTWTDRFLKRATDVMASIVVLVLGFPFFLAIALLIKITSKGPVFFKQERVGEDGGIFALFKFRTMRTDCDDSLHREFTRNFIQGRLPEPSLDASDCKVYKMTDDPRITAIGGFLRKTSLDELPQFINILKGEMTIVGPRPPLPYEYECYEEWARQRLKVRPGLTGLWQVSGRSSVSFKEMVDMDIYYIQNWSLKLDFKIMLKTVPVMLAGTGGH